MTSEGTGGRQHRDGAGPPLSPDFLTDLFRDPLEPGYAAAAARRSGPPPPWWRRRGSPLTLLVVLLVGVLLAVSYRQVVQDEPTRAQVRSELVEQIQRQDEQTKLLEKRADELRDEVARLRDRQLAAPQARQLRELEAATGLARVRGDGVVVVVGDGSEQVDPITGAPVGESRILDYDLQRITNALWAAGAEAVAINDRRLTSTSTIRSASGAILVNRLPVASPYEIAAVGQADLAQRFADSATGHYLTELVNRYDIAYEVRPANDLTLPAAVTPVLRYAARADQPSASGGNR
jgi:uncharacterized protein YlxW (UPF0749 family)